MRFIKIIEETIGQKAVKNMLPMQAGDVPFTFAEIDDLINDVGFKPETTVEEGIRKFISWYYKYHNIVSGK